MKTLSQNPNLKNEKGFSLLELLLVVAVGAVLILAGLAAYRLVTENNNVNDAVRLLNTMKQQTQRAFQSEGDYGDTDDDLVGILTSLRAFPAGVLNGDGVPQHPFGGDIAIEAEAAGQQFSITYTGIEEAACIQLGQQFNTGTDSDFVSFSLDDGATPLDDTALATLEAACADDGNDLTWYFY